MAAKAVDIVALSTTLAPPDSYPVLRRGLIAVTTFGFLSFFTSVALFLRLAYKLLTWKEKSPNQFVTLIFSLIFADIQQSIAFWLNAVHLRQNSIAVGTSTCWAQGWFLSTGNLSSGLFTLAIAVHSFMDIVYDYRLGQRAFLGVIFGLWTFNYLVAAIGVALHPTDLYVRAGAWCWINIEYTNERLYLHYFWVIIAEFGTVLIYASIIFILQQRVKSSFYSDSETSIRARLAMKLIIAYPDNLCAMHAAAGESTLD